MSKKVADDFEEEWPCEPPELNFPPIDTGVVIKNASGKKRLIFPYLLFEMLYFQKFEGMAWKKKK
jgi:hypothetical protein